ncbi:MAG: N-acetyltransferase [Anaerolineae bacterium]
MAQTPAVQIRKVETPADFKPFFEFPWTLYKDDPNWVPPLLSMRHEMFDRKKGPAWEYLEGDYFTAWRGNRIVGTIAAYINHRHNEFHNEQVGWFGAFECFDDPVAATALLNTAIQWVKDMGYPIIRGPQTFTTHEDTGLLVEGFTPPVLLYPYNPQYYATLIEGAGFAKSMDMFSFNYERDEVLANNLLERLGRITQGVMRRNKVTIRPFDNKKRRDEFKLIKELYNAGWDRNWGFVPLTERELDGLIDSLATFLDPRLVYFGYVDDQPAGFILGIPDFNQVLRKVYARPGVPEVFSLLKALYYWKVRPIMTWSRVPLMGVKPDYRNKGVDAAMYFYLLRTMLTETQYVHNDSGWILEVNKNMMGIAQSFGGNAYKRFRLYERTT